MLDVYRDLIDELLESPTAIREAVGEVQNQAVADQIATQVSLIRNRDIQVLDRARAMMQRSDAFFDDSVPISAGDVQALDQIMGEMETARGDLVSLLINLSLKDWERTAILKSVGEVTLSDIIEDHVEFDEAARIQVRAILKNG